MNPSDVPEEIAALIKAAEDGAPEAQFELGQKYRLGQGVKQSESIAADWYRKAAEQGYDRGQNALGVIHKGGLGVEQNYSEAIAWYHKAIAQGNTAAMWNLGEMYREGLGIEQSDSEAIAWYRKAAEHGDISAQCALGEVYIKGLLVEQSDREAAKWYRKAAEQGEAVAQNNLGWIYQNSRDVELHNSEAIDWYRKAAEQGYALAQHNLGWAYMNGRDVGQSNSEAIAWYRKAAEQGEANAQFNLGLIYMWGLGIQRDYIEAQKLFRQSATTSNPDLRFKAIENQDQAERYELSSKITEIRINILNQLKVDVDTTPTMTHYTSLMVGSALLLEKSPLRIGHINALNDPNEGKLLWRYLGHAPVEGKPVFVGCFLPDDDSLNMWRFYSKNNQNDDACGCAITFKTDKFFNYSLLPELNNDAQEDQNSTAFSNTGKSPQESAAFYRIIYIDENMNIRDEAKLTLETLFSELKEEAKKFIEIKPGNERLQQLSRLLGPLPYLLKDADYEAEKEHRVIVTHLEYGAKEIQTQDPILVDGIPKTSPRLFLELHRANHLDPTKHVTLGPKSPHQEMMAPYWHHKLASEFPDQLKAKADFYVRASKCAYK